MATSFDIEQLQWEGGEVMPRSNDGSFVEVCRRSPLHSHAANDEFLNQTGERSER